MFLDSKNGGCIVSDNPTREELMKAGLSENDAVIVLDFVEKARAKDAVLETTKHRKKKAKIIREIKGAIRTLSTWLDCPIRINKNNSCPLKENEYGYGCPGYCWSERELEKACKLSITALQEQLNRTSVEGLKAKCGGKVY